MPAEPTPAELLAMLDKAEGAAETPEPEPMKAKPKPKPKTKKKPRADFFGVSGKVKAKPVSKVNKRGTAAAKRQKPNKAKPTRRSLAAKKDSRAAGTFRKSKTNNRNPYL